MSDKNEKPQLKRKFISLEDKVEILNRLKDGEKISSVGKSFDLNESTIRTVRRNEDKIRRTVADGCPMSAKRTTRYRNIDIVKTERKLMIWLNNCISKNIPVRDNDIKEKALQIYNHLIETKDLSSDDEKRSNFTASKGWLEKLKKRYSLLKIQFEGEETGYKFSTELPDNLNACKTNVDTRKRSAENMLINPLFTSPSLNTRSVKNINKSQLHVLRNSNKICYIPKDIFIRSPDSYSDMIKNGNNHSISEKVNSNSRVTGRKFKQEEQDLNKLFRKKNSNDEVKSIDDASSNALVKQDTDKEFDNNFNLSVVKKGLDWGEQLRKFFIKNDPLIERREKFNRELEKCLAPYKDLSLILQNKTAIKIEKEDTLSEEFIKKL